MYELIKKQKSQTDRIIWFPKRELANTNLSVHFKRNEKKNSKESLLINVNDRWRLFYIIVQSRRSLAGLCEKQERKGEESRFIRFSNLVHQAGCIPSNRVRQIYRGIMQIMRLPAAIIVFSGYLLARPRNGRRPGEKVNRKVNARPLCTGHFHSIRQATERCSARGRPHFSVVHFSRENKPGPPPFKACLRIRFNSR